MSAIKAARLATELTLTILVLLFIACSVRAEQSDRVLLDQEIAEFFKKRSEWRNLGALVERSSRSREGKEANDQIPMKEYVELFMNHNVSRPWVWMELANKSFLQNPADDVGFRALTLVALNTWHKSVARSDADFSEERYMQPSDVSKLEDEVFSLLTKYHSDREDLWEYFSDLKLRSRNGRPITDAHLEFLEHVANHNPSRSTRAGFSISLVRIFRNRVINGRNLGLSAAEVDLAKHRGMWYSSIVQNEYSDVRLGESPIPLGEQVEELTSAFLVGQLAPEISLPDLKGMLDHLSAYRGKVVLLDFWATWCAPCVAELPELEAFHKEMAGENFELISISSDYAVSDVLEFQRRTPMPWIHWFRGAEDREIARDYSVPSIPVYVLIDANGVIRSRERFGERVRNLARELVLESGELAE